jgi:glycosyltransferase involved in cell wall biosynthesis
LISNTEAPYISVIITAHNRKEFLKDAINSVLNQTLEKSFYEIIVIKNFEDQEIDNLIEENKIISLKVRDDSLIGEDLAIGIEKAKGEIISFLDDDDLFMPEKLETVYSFFKKYEDLVYFHNSCYFVDERGKLLKKGLKENPNENIILNNIENLNQILGLFKYGLWFNMSSISIKKNKIIPFIEKLKLINDGPDTFMFVVSILYNPKLFIISNEKLTKYRLHESATQFLNKNIIIFNNSYIVLLNKTKDTNKILIELCNDNKILKNYFNFKLVKINLQLHLLEKERNIKLNELLFYFYTSLKIKDLNSKKDLIYYLGLYILSKISYEKVRNFYSRRFFNYSQKRINSYIKLE